MAESESKNPAAVPPKKTGVSRLLAATGYSYQGLKSAFENEEAFRIELAIFCIFTPIALWLADSAIEQVLLIGSMGIVLLAELINSAIEAVVDRSGLDFHPLAGRAKDLGSAAVFVAMMLVLFTWVILLL